RTPRRSTRLNNRTGLQDRPVRSSPRTTRAAIDYQGKAPEEDCEQSSDEEDGDGSSREDDEEPEVAEHEDYDLMGNFELFSDEDRQPSPSAFQLEKSLEQSGRFESAQSTPHKDASSSPRAWSTSPAVVVHRLLNHVPATPLSEQRQLRNRPIQSPARDEDGDVDMDEDEYMATKVEDDSAGSDVGSPDPPSSSSGSGLFVRQNSPDPSLRPSLRSRKQQVSTNARVLRSHKSAGVSAARSSPTSEQSSEESESGRTRLPSQDAPARPRRSTRRQPSPPSRLRATGATRQSSTGALASRRIRGRASRIIYNYTARESPEPESKYPHYKDAMKIGKQQENWKILIDEAREMMKKKASSSSRDDLSMEEYFGDMQKLIDLLNWPYENLHQSSKLSHDLRKKDAQQFVDLLERIKCVGHRALDDVYRFGVDRDDEEKACEIFGAFEAHMIPALIRLSFTVFDRYHSSPRRFPEAYNHLFRTMSVLFELSDRMATLVQERCVRTVTRCKNLQSPLKELIKASKDGLLKRTERASPEQEHEIRVKEPKKQDPWTETEGAALMNGLQQHLGLGRYALIQRDSGGVLGRRTIPELREKARFAYDRIVPQIQDKISTRQGREQWHWLLSVRES
ncbi:hypothetical protein BDV06DRAFT_202587, partial [Aspergillus oleicola]